MKKLNCVLLVDDDEADNMFHKRNLKKAEVTEKINVVNNGEEALHYLNHENGYNDENNYPTPDLIFLDINMPRLNGFEFLERFENLPENVKSSPIIIMLSTSINPADEEKAKSIPFVKGFISKPLNIDNINAVIEQYF